MQRSFYSIGLLFLCLLAGPTVLRAQTPLQFNDKLVAITDSLFTKGQQWGLKFNEAYKANDFTVLAPYRQRLEAFIDHKISEVNTMKDVKDSKALRQSMINFLLFEKGMITKAFKPMEDLGKSPTTEQVKAAYDQLTVYSKEETVALGQVTQAQEAYASANGFTIEPPKEEAAEPAK